MYQQPDQPPYPPFPAYQPFVPSGAPSAPEGYAAAPPEPFVDERNQPARKRKKPAPEVDEKTGEPTNRRRVRRHHGACARCSRKKIKCDSKLPSCTACRDANVECHQEDRNNRTFRPRGYTEQIETQLAKCEALLKKYINDFRIDDIDNTLAREGLTANVTPLTWGDLTAMAASHHNPEGGPPGDLNAQQLPPQDSEHNAYPSQPLPVVDSVVPQVPREESSSPLSEREYPPFFTQPPHGQPERAENIDPQLLPGAGTGTTAKGTGGKSSRSSRGGKSGTRATKPKLLGLGGKQMLESTGLPPEN